MFGDKHNESSGGNDNHYLNLDFFLFSIRVNNISICFTFIIQNLIYYSFLDFSFEKINY